MTHSRKVCKHGTVRSQCRCAAPNKISILVECPLSHGDWYEEQYPIVYTGTVGQEAQPVIKWGPPEKAAPAKEPVHPPAVTWGRIADVLEAEGHKLASNPPGGFTIGDQKASIPLLYLIAGVVRAFRKLDKPDQEE